MARPSAYFWEGLARMRVGGVSLHNRADGHTIAEILTVLFIGSEF